MRIISKLLLVCSVSNEDDPLTTLRDGPSCTRYSHVDYTLICACYSVIYKTLPPLSLLIKKVLQVLNLLVHLTL